jgi:hypothetical protein
VSGSRIDRGLGIVLGVLPRIWPSRFISTTPTREEAPSHRSEGQTRVEPALGFCLAVYLITEREGRKRADRRTERAHGHPAQPHAQLLWVVSPVEAQDPGIPATLLPHKESTRDGPTFTGQEPQTWMPH